MTLRALRDRLSLLHVALACVAVVLGGGVRWASLGLATALVAWAFVRPLRPEPSRRSSRLWTIGVFIALVATLARVLLLAEFLDAGVDFLLLLIVQRFFNRQRAREHLQLLMLSTLMMIVAAVINTGLNYPILLGGFLLVSTMTLIVNHLLAEGERLGPRVAVGIARAGMGRLNLLWRAAGGVAAMAALGGLLVFAFFPRWGAGVFLRGAMAREAQSGFSGEVQLGQFGRIKSDATVTARLEIQGEHPTPKRLTWHLRGSSFDVYEGGRWRHGPRAEATPLEAVGGFSMLAPEGEPLARRRMDVARPRDRWGYEAVAIPGFAASTQTVRARVILEDLGVDVLFAASEPLGARVIARGPLERRATVRGGKNRELRVDKPPGPIMYEFLSRPIGPSPGELEAVGEPEVPPELRPFLQRSDALSDDIRNLARSITEGATTRHAKTQAVLEHLSTFRYTLDLEPSQRVLEGADPVEGFVFDTQAGHCEYFATAMAVLLREVGVPTRLVNGYYGAHYNEMGEFYAVRQADAHSWVEVHFGPLGWVTFDPTPPAGRLAGDDAPLWGPMTQAVDAMRNAYLEYVIDYDLGKQLSLLRNLGLSERGSGHRSVVAWRGILVWGGALVGIVLLIRPLRRPSGPKAPPEVRIYEDLLARLAAKGHHPTPSESPSRFAARLRREDVAGAEAFEGFTRYYEAARFGPSPADLAPLVAAARVVKSKI